MSEYQYYEFVAVDRPLDAQQLAQVRALSTRAEISLTRFVNEYHWGNFRGNPREMVEAYYDGFLYLANWGTREVMIRLPSGVVTPATARRYCVTDCAASWSKSGNTIIHLYRDGDGDDDFFDEDPSGRLGSIISIRAELAAGDTRPLYLAWLHSVAEGELDDDAVEPPVPANLGALSAAQRSLVDFIRVDEDLLAAAADGSPRTATPQRPSAARLKAWVADLPPAEKDALLVKVMSGDRHVGAQLLSRFHGRPDAELGRAGGRTVAQLLEAAQARREDRARQQADQRQRQQQQRAREAAAARERRLDALAREGEAVWQRVVVLIEARKPREYDTAVTLLSDLHALATRDDDLDRFHKRATELARQYSGRPALQERLQRAGLPTSR